MTDTSFEKASNWYAACTSDMGHYFHRKIIFPKLKHLAKLNENSKVLDLACGSGVLQRWLAPKIEYVGLDSSKTLIKEAEKNSKSNQKFIQADVTKKLPIEDKYFSHAFIILALQNIEEGEKVIQNAAKHLKNDSRLFIVINHPCFRIPRQSRWEVDDEQKTQSRQLSAYMSSMKIPIKTHPSKKASPITYSFHHPVSTYSSWLYSNKLAIERIIELCSDKKSTGRKAKMENRARKEFPLFMIITAKKMG